MIEPGRPPGPCVVAAVAAFGGDGVVGVLAFRQPTAVTRGTLAWLGILMLVTNAFPKMGIVATATVAGGRCGVVSRCAACQTAIMAVRALALQLGVVNPKQDAPGAAAVAVLALIPRGDVLRRFGRRLVGAVARVAAFTAIGGAGENTILVTAFTRQLSMAAAQFKACRVVVKRFGAGRSRQDDQNRDQSRDQERG